MPPIEFSVAALIVSPDEVLRENVRCPNVECRCTDELLSRKYNATASLGHVSNSWHTLSVTDLSELTLKTMGVIANHCGTALGTPVILAGGM